ncbi:MAG: NAD(P)-dependent oxidoreductase [Bacteroidales bacterium]|nr:NAD(P)-dependent oxidoreductase [Bacteroidales bacterium]
MNKIVVLTEKPFASDAVNKISDIAKAEKFDIKFVENYKTKEEAYEGVKDAEALIVRSDIVDKDLISHAPNLKIVVRAGAGYDNIDLNACTERKIVVMNTPGQNSNAVAELVFGLLLYMVRNYFDGSTGTELKGKKIGIHAYGNVGKHVARIAKGFDMDVYAYDPFVNSDEIKKDNITPLSSVEELYQTCQIISIHIPATNETIKSINAKLFEKLPKNAIIVNTARKEVINEEDLIAYMEKREDIKYVTDIQMDHHSEMIERFPKRYFATAKKLGAQTKEANNNAGIAAVKQIIAFFNHGDTTFQVNK